MIEKLICGVITQKEALIYYEANVSYKILPKYINGLVFNYKGINNIIINKNLSYYKKRKTLIHELTHIELNHLCQLNNLFAFYIQDYEDEDDRYIKKLLESI